MKVKLHMFCALLLMALTSGYASTKTATGWKKLRCLRMTDRSRCKKSSSRTLPAMKVLAIMLSCFLLVGCAATLEDFEEMSAAQRAEYVCRSDRNIVYLASQVNEAYEAMSETKEAIARGYRVHETCSYVNVPAGEVCDWAVNGTIVCNTVTKRERVCEETPVSIDGALEEKKLRRYENTYHEYRSRLTNEADDCTDKVQRMSARRSFEYYQAVR